MKTSSRILIGAAVGLAAGVVVIVVIARLFFGGVVTIPVGTTTAAFVPSSTSTSKDFQVTGFTGVSASGAWDLTVRQATSYSVSVTVPDNLLDRVDVHKEGSLVVFAVKPGTTITNWRMHADVSMPKLDQLRLSGANRASFEGFDGNRLQVVCSGAAQVSGSGRGYTRLTVNASGASMVDFKALPTDNAVLHLSGAGQAELQMKGGELTGQLSGAAKLVYWGPVSRQAVQTSGIGSITHK